jgi:ribA/ribD-fused uncharacterized protein
MERITDTHVFFWNSELSNWYPAKFRYKGITFANSEQAFMWEKAMFFGDMNAAQLIYKETRPNVAKAIGRKVKGFDAEKWLTASYKIMVDVVYAKFSQNSNLKDVLLSTGDKTIVEASPYDTIWGIGMHWEDDRVLDEKNWRGQNLLGKALMEVREKLR